MTTWNHTSVFSEIGGFELAARAVWGEDHNILEMVEIGHYQRAILAQTFEGVPIHDDIKTWASGKYLGRSDLFSGGPPCQPFSYAGVRRGKADDRDLWPQTLSAVRSHRPRWVVLENVPGLATMEQSLLQTKVGAKTYLQTDIPPEGDKPPRFSVSHSTQITERWFKAYLYHIVKELEEADYTVCVVNIPALAVGADHERARLWIVAHSNEAPSDSDGLREQQSSGRLGEIGGRAGDSGETASESEGAGLSWRSASGNEPAQPGPAGHHKQSEFCERFAKPGIRGVVDGLPNRAYAIEALGGAVVVPVVAEIFHKIKKIDEKYYGGE